MELRDVVWREYCKMVLELLDYLSVDSYDDWAVLRDVLEGDVSMYLGSEADEAANMAGYAVDLCEDTDIDELDEEARDDFYQEVEDYADRIHRCLKRALEQPEQPSCSAPAPASTPSQLEVAKARLALAAAAAKAKQCKGN